MFIFYLLFHVHKHRKYRKNILCLSSISKRLDFFSDMSGKPKFNYIKKKKQHNK